MFEAMNAVCTQDPPALLAPAPVARLAARLLARDPSARPVDGDALARELVALGSGGVFRRMLGRARPPQRVVADFLGSLP